MRVAREGERLMKANIPWFNCLIKPAIQTFQKERGRGKRGVRHSVTFLAGLYPRTKIHPTKD